MAALKNPLPRANFALVDPASGRPTQVFAQYLSALDAFVRALGAGNVGPLTNAANDAAAAAAGVAIGQLYRTGNAVQIRLT